MYSMIGQERLDFTAVRIGGSGANLKMSRGFLRAKVLI